MTFPSQSRGMFENIFSKRTEVMKPSEIRELLKYTQQPGVISFGGGLPGPEAFTVREIAEVCQNLLRSQDAHKVLQYGTTEGVGRLIDVIISEILKHEGIDATRENLLITTGAQQALDLISKALLNPGDRVIVEGPTYLGALSSFQAFEAKIIHIPLDDNGMNIERLSEYLAKHKSRFESNPRKKPKFIYVCPTFHNPAGVTMTLSRRQKLIELAHEYDLLIIEDDPYSQLRYEGEPLPTIKSLDKENRVLLLCTFSKTLVPGLRLSYSVGEPELIRKLVIVKQATDLCTQTFGQFIAAEYIANGHYWPHIEKIKTIYGAKLRTMLSAIEQYFPKRVRWTRPQGGMFIWVTLPRYVDARKMLQKALAQKVAYVTGTSFYADGRGANQMRLNFSYPSHEEITEGIKRLGAVIETEIHETRMIRCAVAENQVHKENIVEKSV